MFRVNLKFASFQLTFAIVNLQNFILAILGKNGIPACEGSRGPLMRGSSECIDISVVSVTTDVQSNIIILLDFFIIQSFHGRHKHSYKISQYIIRLKNCFTIKY